MCLKADLEKVVEIREEKRAVSRRRETTGSRMVEQMFVYRKDKRYRAGLIQGLRMAGALTQDEWERFDKIIKLNSVICLKPG